MKLKLMSLISTCFLLILYLPTSCNTPADNVKDAQQNVKEANDDLSIANQEYEKDVENYRLKTEKQIALNDSIIVDLKSKSQKSVKSNPYYKFEIEELEAKNRTLEQKMKGYKGDEKDNWNKFKEELNYDMEELGKAIRNFMDKNSQ